MIHIIVCVKPICDAKTIQWDYQTGKWNYESSTFNPADLHALQWAVNFKHDYGAKITVLLAKDANSSVEVSRLQRFPLDELVLMEIENLNNLRYEASYQLFFELKQRSYDLILCGSEGEDFHSGVTPIMLAEYLNIPSLTHIHHIEPNESKLWKASRKEGRGIVQTFQIKLPALIGVIPSISRMRYTPKNLNINRDSKMNIRKISLSALRLSKIRVVKTSAFQPNIRYFLLPSSNILAQKRLLQVVGLDRSQSESGSKIDVGTSKHIHYVAQRIQRWKMEE
jgi:electron transfer flavoprotein alpha/beta subunit